ncbi:DNA repair protein RecN [Natranaerobius thermophilus]|uniref:DNA repair protein RecN n=1 Tax=Natranaerobius thermophilus (strain ATCC BAA-1301 / DSM 18059 / JW/NM-WN-LF) TaxID=457570 RepID=B2A523_NATTJ|nr:DNA repair protein RecN [Natranaerobius thermophilus]ACB85265.1 DNA repair protein RecN [Natranaerobius thermophilus JW/NM-WN-LF]
MLVHLNIKDFALIDHLILEPGPGLNILTGETGAGKTIILDALGLILGGRASTEYIRTGSKKAIVQGVFQLKSGPIDNILEEWGIAKEDNQLLIITREISQGKSIAKINDQIVTVNKLKELGKQLVDIHGQHDHQSLLNIDKHLDLLDAYGGSELLQLREMISELYQQLQQNKQKLQELIQDPKERARRLELLEYQQREIEEANLDSKEEQELIEQRNKLQNIERLREAVGFAYTRIYEGEEYQPSVIDSLGSVLDKLRNAVDIDNKIENFYQQVEQEMIKIEELSRDINNYIEEMDINPMELQEIEDRINTYNELKRKYGNSIEEIMNYLEDIASEIDYLKNTENQRIQLEQEQQQITDKLNNLSQQLHNKRMEVKPNLEENIISQLKDLAMDKVQFSVDLQQTKLNSRGFDKAEFLFSPNKGEPVKSLVKIASGGELARVMLALKSIFSDIDNISTLVFDEVDTGISGTAAQKVAYKLQSLSDNTQILCVTHLPQVASKADEHFKLSKSDYNGRTATEINTLSRQDRIFEIAKMIDGEEPSKTSLEHAENMIFGRD